MYTIIVRNLKSNRYANVYITGNIDDLFSLVSLFDRLDYIKEFKVLYEDAGRVLPRHFGWAEFKKWVLTFDNEG